MQTKKLNEKELELKIPYEASWHQDYSNTNCLYVGNLPPGITEGDLVIIFSQYGTPTNALIVRNKKSGESLGFAYLTYEDQRSTALAVDNFDGMKILGKTLKVDHSRQLLEPLALEVVYNDPNLATI